MQCGAITQDTGKGDILLYADEVTQFTSRWFHAPTITDQALPVNTRKWEPIVELHDTLGSTFVRAKAQWAGHGTALIEVDGSDPVIADFLKRFPQGKWHLNVTYNGNRDFSPPIVGSGLYRELYRNRALDPVGSTWVKRHDDLTSDATVVYTVTQPGTPQEEDITTIFWPSGADNADLAGLLLTPTDLSVRPGESFEVAARMSSNWEYARLLVQFFKGSDFVSEKYSHGKMQNKVGNGDQVPVKMEVKVPIGVDRIRVIAVEDNAEEMWSGITVSRFQVGRKGLPWFSGEFSPDPDLLPRWTGTALKSESTLSGQLVAGWSQAKSEILSSIDDEPAVRILSDPEWMECYAGFDLPLDVASLGGKFTAGMHSSEVPTGTLTSRARRAIVSSPEQMSTAQPPAVTFQAHTIDIQAPLTDARVRVYGDERVTPSSPDEFVWFNRTSVKISSVTVRLSEEDEDRGEGTIQVPAEFGQTQRMADGYYTVIQ